MSSNYNSRGRAAEVMVDGDQAYVVRERETVEKLFASESLFARRLSRLGLRYSSMYSHGTRGA